jgi:hypothetical protein
MPSDASEPLLTDTLLEELLEALTRAGFPTVERLRPGLSDDEMDTLTAPLGLTLPTEPRVWWRRQNGGKNALVGAYRDFASLQDMVEQTHHMRAVHRGVEAYGVLWWKDNLIPMFQDTTQFGCDCSVAWGDPSPIWVLIPSDADNVRGPVLSSLGALVMEFTRAIGEGMYLYVPEDDVCVIEDGWPPFEGYPYGMP